MPEPSRRVAILLSTYNGARFLPEQLSSLLAQTHDDWMLHWRDDGSRDNTQALMRDFASGAGLGRCIERPSVLGNEGVLASYMSLLREAVPSLGEADAVAFADQDDVWLPEKLAHALAILPNDITPVLYCARYVRTDAVLRRLGESERLRRPPGFPQALTQNIATGCTIVLNRAASRLIAASAPPAGSIHDWWSYLVVSAAGGRVLRDETPVLLYRQHASNAVGAAPTWTRRIAAALRRGPAQFMTLLRAHVGALLAREHMLSPQARVQLRRIDHALRSGETARARALFLPGLRRQGVWETFLFRAWFMFG